MTTPTISTPSQKDALSAVSSFSRLSGLHDPETEIKIRPDGNYLLIKVGNPTERLFAALNEALENLPSGNTFKGRMTLKRRTRAPSSRLSLPEARYLRTVLSESLTVNRHSFEEDFFSRYIRSVFSAEDQIVAQGNHIVFGRRGAGKSSLLAYRLNQLRRDEKPYAWVAMQTYQGQMGLDVVANVFMDILGELRQFSSTPQLFGSMRERFEGTIAEGNGGAQEIAVALDRLLAPTRRLLASLAEERGAMTIFLDDIHVVDESLQPVLLAKLYSITRGNRMNLKLSGIEAFTHMWNPVGRIGLQHTHDIQVIRLDYNLTMPEKSMAHIESILDAHARYCGLSSIRHICGAKVLERLVLAAAGVPRDAMNLFAQAMSRAIVRDDKKVSITAINAAVSEMAEEKLRDVQRDVSENTALLKSTLDQIKKYCIGEIRMNAFLVEIENDNPTFQRIEELTALRLLHVLHEAITPDRASRRFKAFMLDFGFYVGIRAAKSLELFQSEPTPLLAKELRGLPKYSLPQESDEKASRA